MTTNDEQDIHCLKHNCYGVVKQYEYGGVREAPDEVRAEKESVARKLKEIAYKLLGKDVEPVTWYECSMCHKLHDVSEDQW